MKESYNNNRHKCKILNYKMQKHGKGWALSTATEKPNPVIRGLSSSPSPTSDSSFLLVCTQEVPADGSTT